MPLSNFPWNLWLLISYSFNRTSLTHSVGCTWLCDNSYTRYLVPPSRPKCGSSYCNEHVEASVYHWWLTLGCVLININCSASVSIKKTILTTHHPSYRVYLTCFWTTIMSHLIFPNNKLCILRWELSRHFVLCGAYNSPVYPVVSGNVWLAEQNWINPGNSRTLRTMAW